MALQDLQKELNLIKKALKNTDKYGGGAGNPVRKYLDSAFADIDTSVGQLKQELKEIKRIATPGGKAESTMNAIDDADLASFALQYITVLQGVFIKKSDPNKIEWVPSGGMVGPGSLAGSVRYNRKNGVQNVYNWVADSFKKTFAIMDADKDNPISVAIISAANQETYDEKQGQMVKPKQRGLFDAGHIESVLDAKVALTQASIFGSENLEKAFGVNGQNLVEEIIRSSADRANLPITITREHDIDAKTGKLVGSTNVRLRPESWTENQAKGAKTSSLGAWVTRNKTGMIDSISTRLNEILEEEYGDADDYMDRKSSPSMRDSARFLVLGNPTMKKAFKTKKATLKGKPVLPIKSFKTPLSDNVKLGTAKESKLKGKFITKFGRKVPKAKDQTTESGPGIADEAFKTRAFINSRLTKQIQSNMGRPALENQSGRLAESALVTNAVPQGAQIHMDYTYNPLYRVFENGAGQYSANYDPRELIEKSIRELAAERITTKFTLRRV